MAELERLGLNVLQKGSRKVLGSKARWVVASSTTSSGIKARQLILLFIHGSRTVRIECGANDQMFDGFRSHCDKMIDSIRIEK